jgi:hypothetical protein
MSVSKQYFEVSVIYSFKHVNTLIKIGNKIAYTYVTTTTTAWKIKNAKNYKTIIIIDVILLQRWSIIINVNSIGVNVYANFDKENFEIRAIKIARVYQRSST